MNKNTRIIVELLVEIVDVAIKLNKKIFIGGGLALEIEAASVAKRDSFTRNHGDLDIHPMEEDISFWKDWFLKKGFSINTNEGVKDSNKAFTAYPPNYEPGSPYVDVYGVFIDKNGFIHSRESGEDDNWKLKWDEATIICSWNNRKISVLRHELALKNKRQTAKTQNKSLREIDVHDHKLFNVDPSLPT